MGYLVTVNEDDASEIVRLSLQKSLSSNLASVGDKPDEYESALIAGMFVVLQYYSTKEQFDAFVEEENDAFAEFNDLLLGQKSGISNLETVEESDGSLTVSFDANEETRDRLAAKGVEYSVLLGILGTSSIDEIIRLVERGRQEEKTDDIMRRFNEARAECESE